MIDEDNISDKILYIDSARLSCFEQSLGMVCWKWIETLILPPKGADINIIENIWKILKAEVFESIQETKSKEELYNSCR